MHTVTAALMRQEAAARQFAAIQRIAAALDINIELDENERFRINHSDPRVREVGRERYMACLFEGIAGKLEAGGFGVSAPKAAPAKVAKAATKGEANNAG